MTLGQIFSRVHPFFERAVSDLDRSMHRSLWDWVAQSSFIEGSHMTKNTASRPVEVAHNSFIEGSHTAKNTASGLVYSSVIRENASYDDKALRCFPDYVAKSVCFCRTCKLTLRNLDSLGSATTHIKHTKRCQ